LKYSGNLRLFAPIAVVAVMPSIKARVAKTLVANAVDLRLLLLV
jgi:hypothetical protein